MPKTSSIRSAVLVELRLVTDSWYRGCIASRGKNYATSEFGVFARSVGVKPLWSSAQQLHGCSAADVSPAYAALSYWGKSFSVKESWMFGTNWLHRLWRRPPYTFKKRLDEWIDVELIISPVLLIHYCYKLQVTSYPPSFGIQIVVLDIRGCVRNVSQSAIWLYDKTPAWHTQTSTRHLRALSHASPGRYNWLFDFIDTIGGRYRTSSTCTRRYRDVISGCSGAIESLFGCARTVRTPASGGAATMGVPEGGARTTERRQRRANYFLHSNNQSKV